MKENSYGEAFPAFPAVYLPLGLAKARLCTDGSPRRQGALKATLALAQGKTAAQV
jgi:hypothetical protein